MKILHTSDWHLGRTFKHASLIDDHQHFLDQLKIVLDQQKPDVLIIAGDIFDRASPPASAVSQFEDFQRHVYFNTQTALIILAGNHDSGERVGMNGAFADPKRVLIRGRLQRDEKPLILNDEFGEVAFSALPYGEIFSARECFEKADIATPADVLNQQVECAKQFVPNGARWVISAHAFVTGASTTETERSLCVGGIETVSADTFNGAHYVALGHLHRSQKVGAEHIRYSGSPLSFAFDEVGNEKSMTLITLGQSGVENIDLIPIKPLRAVREIRGALSDLEKQTDDPNNQDFIHAILTDKGGLVEPMARLRRVYPNVIALTRENKNEVSGNSTGRANAKLDNPQEVISEFIQHVRETAIDPDEQSILDNAMNASSKAEA
ncbi:exonuclease SbcCD subunit D [Hirschia baltica]|uniref:Nuclease SbcCD subunit D n=1 Tax=Hirschia baltica (strain ATCC 49814 / DSM 5838 / IFAM 1418) TaxID=582402 RepID=C6XKD2_HIRBI|nr:exonuclease SbcCD subunit D [Hirschia baltica]ACT57730.1 nuclease SbcCD, D subunit [Hirschia baltica ATCC 49814]